MVESVCTNVKRVEFSVGEDKLFCQLRGEGGKLHQRLTGIG